METFSFYFSKVCGPGKKMFGTNVRPPAHECAGQNFHYTTVPQICQAIFRK